MTTYYLAVQHSRFLSDADRSVLTGSDDANLSTPIKGKVILATMLGLNLRDTQDAAYKLQWRNVTDSGSFADVASTGQVKWSTSTDCGAADGDAVAKTDMKCTNMDSTMTWQNGLFNLGDNLAPDSGTYVTSADVYTEFHWALDLTDSLDNKQYEFLVYNVTQGATAGTCAAKITIQSITISTACPVAITEAKTISVDTQPDLAAFPSQSAHATEVFSVSSVQADLSIPISQSAKATEAFLAEAETPGIGYKKYGSFKYGQGKYGANGPSINESLKLTEVSAVAIEAGELAALSISGSESFKISEDKTTSVDSQITLSPQVDDHVKISEVITAQVDLGAATDDHAKVTEDKTVSVATAITLDAQDSDHAKVTEVISAEIGAIAAMEISATDHAKATEDRTISIDSQVILGVQADDHAKVTEVSTEDIGAIPVVVISTISDHAKVNETIGTAIDIPDIQSDDHAKATELLEVAAPVIAISCDVVDSVKLTEDRAAAISAQITQGINVSDNAKISEDIAGVIGAMPAIEITNVLEAVKVSESTTVNVLAQLAVDLAAIDSVAVIEGIFDINRAADTRLVQATDSVLISENTAESIGLPINLDLQVVDYFKLTERINAIVKSLTSIIDIEINVSVTQLGVLTTTGDHEVPIILNRPKINITAEEMRIIATISGTHDVLITEIDNIGFTEMANVEVI